MKRDLEVETNYHYKQKKFTPRTNNRGRGNRGRGKFQPREKRPIDDYLLPCFLEDPWLDLLSNTTSITNYTSVSPLSLEDENKLKKVTPTGVDPSIISGEDEVEEMRDNDEEYELTQHEEKFPHDESNLQHSSNFYTLGNTIRTSMKLPPPSSSSNNNNDNNNNNNNIPTIDHHPSDTSTTISNFFKTSSTSSLKLNLPKPKHS